MTIAVARVLREFLVDRQDARYGYDLMQATGYPSGKLYPILGRLAQAGWLTREKEDVDPSAAKRPARYTYRLTEHGALAAQRELASIADQLGPRPPGNRASRSRRPAWLPRAERAET